MRFCFLVWWGILAGGVVFAAETTVDYSRDIRPILASHCFTCHGPDEASRESGLRLDLRKSALEELESGSVAILPGHPEQSELLARVDTDDESLLMPPLETGKKLTGQEKTLLKLWIEQGAPYAEHWAFSPIKKPVPPAIRQANWARNEIDYFIAARLEKEGLTPSPEASRALLIRRLSLDLTGLPPAFADVQQFVSDQSPDAYEKLVEKLLSSPHFGERWGRHWLDLARYADSNGYLGDELRPQAYHYRDWVINAINADMPYDQFTIEQIAGDLLEDSDIPQKIATGFHRNAMQNTEAGVDKEADRVIQTVDRLGTVGTTWMALTVACAECHTHKFDPISHHEFYQMYAFFNRLESDNPVIRQIEPPPENEKQRQQREQKLEQIKQQLLTNLNRNEKTAGLAGGIDTYFAILSLPKAERTETQSESFDHWYADLDSASKKLAKEYEKVALQRTLPMVVSAQAVRESSKPRKTHVHIRGDFRQPGDEVQPGTPAFLPPLQPRSDQADRLDLARWLVRADHPLTARVAVNHLWQHLFGQGLVNTADNFGNTGSEPSHPELLDWLACELQESGWSRKQLIRLIVNSATYRQSSELTELLIERDPRNELVARQARLRLEGEIVRDMALASSGLLSKKIGGPSVKPPLNSRITKISRNQEWQVSQGEDRYRRGLYTLFRRATPYPMLTTFDVPDSTAACPSRERSNSPLQALTLLNDSVFYECAQQLGLELANLGDVPTETWLTVAVQKTLSRNPHPGELLRLEQFYTDTREILKNFDQKELLKITAGNNSPVDRQEQAARVMIARALMNLEEFITRE